VFSSLGTLYVCFISPIGAIWLPHLNIHHFITQVFGERYKLRSSSVCIFLLFCIIATLVQTFSSVSHLKIPWLCSFSNFRDTVPCPYRTTGWELCLFVMLCGLGWYLVIKILRLFVGPICKGQALKMVPTHCPETSVTNCQSILSNTPEDWRPHLHCSGSVKSYKMTDYYNIYAFR
jgi:hypothetical protein